MATAIDNRRLPQRIKRLYLLQAQAINDALKEHGLARSQWQVLSHVREAGTITQKELQGKLQVEPATLSCIVDTLAAKGWLERLAHPDDKRVKLVRLTAEGERSWTDIPDVVDIVEKRMLEGVSERDAKMLARVVARMTENLGRRREE
ncbi:MAG TPA: MarR family transcriptional regulator [Coriobacteriia bacterium]|jgi:DNA-binding MarR family transcriptional regulator